MSQSFSELPYFKWVFDNLGLILNSSLKESEDQDKSEVFKK